MHHLFQVHEWTENIDSCMRTTSKLRLGYFKPWGPQVDGCLYGKWIPKLWIISKVFLKLTFKATLKIVLRLFIFFPFIDDQTHLLQTFFSWQRKNHLPCVYTKTCAFWWWIGSQSCQGDFCPLRERSDTNWSWRRLPRLYWGGCYAFLIFLASVFLLGGSFRLSPVSNVIQYFFLASPVANSWPLCLLGLGSPAARP